MQNEKFLNSIKNADPGVCDEADSFLQSAMWGRFKSRFGWKPGAFIADWKQGGEKPLLTLSRRIAPGISMTYIPWGPQLPAGFPDEPLARSGAAAELARALWQFLPRDTVFIRFDPPWYIEEPDSSTNPVEAHPQTVLPAPFRRAGADIQPPDTVLIDLTLSHDDILAAMKPKWRYNIGLAEKRGVSVRCNDGQDIDTFYRLLAETASRDGIAIHHIDYYQTLFNECQSGVLHLHLYTAGHEGDTLAAIIVLFCGKQATYLYGASANVKRNLMAPYALQWKAMRDAKAYGCTVYDLFGIPPHDDPDHPMSGLYRFKTGFGGKIIHRPGSWDYPCKPILYTLFTTAERLRKKVRDRRKRR